MREKRPRRARDKLLGRECGSDCFYRREAWRKKAAIVDTGVPLVELDLEYGTARTPLDHIHVGFLLVGIRGM